MAETVGEMTSGELRMLIEALIDQKLAEWLGDPDEGLELNEEIRERIVRQREEFMAVKRGRSLEEMTRRFGLERAALRGPFYGGSRTRP